MDVDRILGAEGTPAVTVNERVTGSAAAKVELPPWLAVIEHWPCATRCTTPPEVTVHTLPVVEANVTARLDEADALTLKSGSPSCRFTGDAKVMDWFLKPLAALAESA